MPDFVNSKIGGERATDVIEDLRWLEEDFTPAIQTRGGLLIKKWGRSSAASTAVSIADAIKALVTPTREGDWFSSGVCTDGNPYGIAEGIIFSMPCRSTGDGGYEVKHPHPKPLKFDTFDTPSTLHPTPYTLNPTPSSLNPTP